MGDTRSRVAGLIGAMAVIALGLNVAAGCAQNPQPLPVPAPVVKTVCPAIRSYTADEQKALAAALTALPAGSPVTAAMLDYQNLRDRLRACNAP